MKKSDLFNYKNTPIVSLVIDVSGSAKAIDANGNVVAKAPCPKDAWFKILPDGVLIDWEVAEQSMPLTA